MLSKKTRLFSLLTYGGGEENVNKTVFGSRKSPTSLWVMPDVYIYFYLSIPSAYTTKIITLLDNEQKSLQFGQYAQFSNNLDVCRWRRPLVKIQLYSNLGERGDEWPKLRKVFVFKPIDRESKIVSPIHNLSSWDQLR